VFLAGVVALFLWVDTTADDSSGPTQAVIDACHARSAEPYSGPVSFVAMSGHDVASRESALARAIVVAWTPRNGTSGERRLALVDVDDGKYEVSTCHF